MNIALIVNFTNPDAITCALRIADILCSEGAKLLMLKEAKNYINTDDYTLFSTYDKLLEACDVAVTVGGDGTIIHSARHACVTRKPILGVNLGHLGYVAELEASEITLLKKLVCGDYTLKDRMVLDVIVIRKSGEQETFCAVNDAVLSRGSLSRIIELAVSLEGKKLCTYRADGLLFSTPTGSTAYALSAGGPVIDPSLSLIELTPVCPHSLTARTVLFSDETVLDVSCVTDDTVYLTVDGQISVELSAGDSVRVKRSDHTLKMINLKDRNFYTIAGEKLRLAD